MDFSESYRASSTNSSSTASPVFSPDGRYIATAVEYRLIIREAESLRVIQLFTCLDTIDILRWAPNSIYVLCGQCKRGLLQVWSVEDSSWSCKIDEGPAGVSQAYWTPDGLGILILAQFQIRTTVWSLMDKKCQYLRGAKSSAGNVAFKPDGTALAVLERYDCKDYLTLYSTSGWQQLAHVPCDTSDAADLAWSPNGEYIAVWDSCLEYRVCIMSAQGHALAHYSAYTGALGVRSVSWNPGGEILAIGSHDQCARLLSHVTWQPLMECAHPQRIEGPEHVVVYREVYEGASPAPSPPGIKMMTPSKMEKTGPSKYVVEDLPVTLLSIKPALDEPNPKLGVGIVRWSPDSQLLATRNDNMPSTVWVWDMAAMELSAVLCHRSEVMDMQWAPNGCTLAMVAGSGKIYLWTPAGASIVHVPLKSFASKGPNTLAVFLRVGTRRVDIRQYQTHLNPDDTEDTRS